MFDVGDGAPEGLSGKLVVGVCRVHFINKAFEIAGVFVDEMWDDAIGEDGDIVLEAFRLNNAFDAICGAGAKKVGVVRLQQLDGVDFDGTGEALVKVEDGLLVIGNFGRVNLGGTSWETGGSGRGGA